MNPDYLWNGCGTLERDGVICVCEELSFVGNARRPLGTNSVSGGEDSQLVGGKCVRELGVQALDRRAL